MLLSRIKEFIDLKGISIAAFEKSIGAANASFAKPLKTGGNIGSDKLENILRIYPELNPIWLMTGRGDMLIEPNDKDKNAYLNAYPNAYLSPKSEGKSDNTNVRQALNKVEQIEVRLPDLLGNDSPLSIPFYDLPVSAGSLGILDIETAEATVPTGYVQLPAFRGCEAIFPITGISMEPIVHSGDWVGIKPIENISRSWDFVQTGVIYFIITREDRMIKFIEKTDDEDFIVCSSPNYNPFKIYKGDILSLYRVKAIARGL